MFSSTMPGEGKSFVAGNLAVSLAYMGKKTLIMGMDIRKPGLNKVFNLSRRIHGITSYLSDPEHTDLFDIIQQSDLSPNLDILPGGPIPPNPTELVARRTLDEAISRLKEKYDYIILDTAPIGMVTDSSIISRVADILVYVCRADYTPKGGFSFINTLRDEHKIPHLATVINSIDMSKRKNSYGYGYGQKFLKEGDIILSTEAEHASNILPWFKVAEVTGATIEYIPLNKDGSFDIENLKKVMSDKVKVITLAHVSNVLGYIMPIKEIATQCGYHDEFFFHRMFKKYMKTTPAKYRKYFIY